MSESQIIGRNSDFVSESDYFKIAALELSNIFPIETKFIDGRVWFYYPKEKVELVLIAFDTGKLKASLRDYAASLIRTKTKIFSIERERRNGATYEKIYPR